MIDIGGGSGLFSFYAAIMGAESVICLEPETKGSTKGATERFKQLSTKLSLNNVGLQKVRFQDFDPNGKKFDIILLHNSINHLNEQACIALENDESARKEYAMIFQKISEIAAPGAELIIADCSRQNFFALLNIANPFEPTIEWYKHQTPEFWINMLSSHNFVRPQIRWTSFSILGKIGRLLFGNRFLSYFLSSHFVLVMYKGSNPAGIQQKGKLKR